MAYIPPLNGGRINASISGGSLVSTGTLVFAGGNNISLSQSTNATGATVSINASGLAGTGFSGTNASATLNSNGLQLSVGAGGGGGGGVALYDGTNSISSGTASIAAAGAITASITNQTLSLAVPAVTSLTAAGGISLSSAGSTITISSPPAASVSNWENPIIQFAPMGAIVQGSLSVQKEYVPFYIAASSAKIGGSLQVGTSTGAQVGSVSLSLWMGLYTMNGNVLSLSTYGSANNSFTFQGASTATASLSSLTGMRELTVPMSVNITPGEYWIGAFLSTATAGGLNASYTIWGNSAQYSASTPLLTPIGGATSAGYGLLPWQGIYKTTVSSMPASISLSAINNTAASNLMRGNFYHAYYNTSHP